MSLLCGGSLLGALRLLVCNRLDRDSETLNGGIEAESKLCEKGFSGRSLRERLNLVHCHCFAVNEACLDLKARLAALCEIVEDLCGKPQHPRLRRHA